MQLTILTGAELRRQPDLQHRAFRLRHKIFVEKLGWEAIRRPDGLETDAFDTDNAVHFLILAANGDIVAYSRLLPTTQPHLLSHVYPYLLGGSALPVGANIWEWTRTTMIPTPTTAKNRADELAGLGLAMSPAARMMGVGVAEWALACGIDTLSLQCDPAFAKVINVFGAKATMLAAPSLTTEKQSVVPMLMCLYERTPAVMRRLFGLEGEGPAGNIELAESARP